VSRARAARERNRRRRGRRDARSATRRASSVAASSKAVGGIAAIISALLPRHRCNATAAVNHLSRPDAETEAMTLLPPASAISAIVGVVVALTWPGVESL
jgi:hypothetical protein